MAQIHYSLSGEHYYVTGVPGRRPRSWVPVADGGDLVPFAFWSVREGRREDVPDDHALVARYALGDRWHADGSPERQQELGLLVENHTHLLDDARKTVAYHERELAIAEQLLAEAMAGSKSA